MKILFYNIQACCGGENQHHLALWNYLRSKQTTLEQICSNIKALSPDVVGIVEIDAGSYRSKNQIAYLAERLGYNYASCCKYLQEATPYLRYQHHAILSRHKILTVKKHHFSKGFKRVTLEAILKTGRKEISVIVTHLSLGPRARERQINELLAIVKKIRRSVILMGDFNQDRLEVEGLTSCCKAKTFPSESPKKQLDYIFVKGGEVKNSTTLPWRFSDHLPLYAELEI